MKVQKRGHFLMKPKKDIAEDSGLKREERRLQTKENV